MEKFHIDYEFKPQISHCLFKYRHKSLIFPKVYPLGCLLDFNAPNFIKHIYFSKQYFKLVFIWDQMYIFMPKSQCNIF